MAVDSEINPLITHLVLQEDHLIKTRLVTALTEVVWEHVETAQVRVLCSRAEEERLCLV
jgi:hypothetical protein